MPEIFVMILLSYISLSTVEFGFNEIGFSDKLLITTFFSCPEVRNAINISFNVATNRM